MNTNERMQSSFPLCSGYSQLYFTAEQAWVLHNHWLDHLGLHPSLKCTNASSIKSSRTQFKMCKNKSTSVSAVVAPLLAVQGVAVWWYCTTNQPTNPPNQENPLINWFRGLMREVFKKALLLVFFFFGPHTIPASPHTKKKAEKKGKKWHLVSHKITKKVASQSFQRRNCCITIDKAPIEQVFVAFWRAPITIDCSLWWHQNNNIFLTIFNQQYSWKENVNGQRRNSD